MKRNILIILIICITLLYSENKIGLVLSGGGVKGMGHIGTLQLIDSLNIPIDYIAGTSIGSIAAGLYASGYSADEIEYLSFNTNWDEIFSQNKKRNHLYFFQKLNSNSHQLEFESVTVTEELPSAINSPGMNNRVKTRIVVLTSISKAIAQSGAHLPQNIATGITAGAKAPSFIRAEICTKRKLINRLSLLKSVRNQP